MKKVKPATPPKWKPYKGFSLESCTFRVGSLDILKNPSRIENSLFYPDGKVVKDAQ